MADQTDKKAQDIRVLKRIVSTTRSILRYLVFDDPNLIAPSRRKVLADGWADVERHVRSILHRLSNCTPRLWSELARCGLTEAQLRMKWSLLDIDLNDGFLGRVLGRINSLLGSLAKAVFAVELLKEYKDHVEISMESLDSKKLNFIDLGLVDEGDGGPTACSDPSGS